MTKRRLRELVEQAAHDAAVEVVNTQHNHDAIPFEPNRGTIASGAHDIQLVPQYTKDPGGQNVFNLTFSSEREY